MWATKGGDNLWRAHTGTHHRYIREKRRRVCKETWTLAKNKSTEYPEHFRNSKEDIMKKITTMIATFAFIVGLAGTVQAKPVEDLNLDISGVAQFGYAWSQANGADDGMDLNRLRIKLKAQPNDNVKFVANIEAEDSNTAGSAFGDNTPANAMLTDLGASSRVVDMYVVLNYLDWATILAGQMPTPVSYELNTDEYALETINYSQFVGIANRDRGFGIVVPFKQINGKWVAWILNGTGGINGAQSDMDDRNNYGTMFEFQPLEQLSFKVWGNFANMADNTGMFPGSTATNLTEMDVDAYGAGLDYKVNNFHFFGEYASAKLKLTDEVTSVRLGSQKTREWYVHASYEIPQTNVQLVARYDKYDPNTSNASDESKITTAGLNWDFDKDARLQIMREFKDGSDNDDLDVQLSVRF